MNKQNGTLKIERTTKFKGFDIAKTSFTTDKFTCKAKIDDNGDPCSNFCEIQRVRIDGEKKPPIISFFEASAGYVL